MVVESSSRKRGYKCFKTNDLPISLLPAVRFESLGNSFSDKLGWKTTKLTRPILLDEMEQSAREGMILIRSKRLLMK